MQMVLRELCSVTRFICTVEFWRMTVLWPLSILFSHYLLLLRRTISSDESVPRLMGNGSAERPVCIITGATSGLGAAAARALSRQGFFVILVGRSSNLLSKTMFEIREQNRKAQLKAFVVDLASFSSIAEFKVSLEHWFLENDMHPSVQLLINNAGILATSCRITADGLDEMMATNYISAFCLTKVDKEFFSGGHFSKFKQYPFARIYENSKLCLLMFSYKVHRQLSLMGNTCHVSINVADPGVVRTNIMREVPSFLSSLAFLALKLVGFLQFPESGVSSILDAALAPPDASGLYFYGGNGRTISPSALSLDPKLQEKLWTTSSDLFLELKLASSHRTAFAS